MSWLMVALIGPGKGPRVPLSKRKSVARITGMKGGNAKVFVDDKLAHVATGDGNSWITEGEYAHVEYDGSSSSFIAEIARES